MRKILPLLVVLPTLAHANLDKFISDSKIKTTFRMDYIDLHSDGLGSESFGFPDYDMGTWAQSAKVALTSGYYNDHFGIDMDAYAVDPIGSQGEGFATREIVKADENGNPKGFVKLPQLFLKQKFMLGDTRIEFFEGRRVLKEYGGTSVEDNAAMSSYNSLTSEIKNDNWFIKLGYLMEYSDSDEDDSSRLLTPEGLGIDYIATSDFAYRNGANEYRYYLTESQDYMRKQQIRYARTLGPDVFSVPAKFTATVTYQQGLTHYKSMSASNRMFDDDAMMLELDAEFFIDETYLKLAYNYTDASRKGSLGKFAFNMADGVQGSQDSITSGNAWDYNNHREHAFAVMAFHDLTDSFTTGLDIRGGFFSYGGDTITQGEVSFVNVWHPVTIPGLSVSFVAARDLSFKQAFDNTPYMVNDKFQRSKGHAWVSTIMYSF